jgi:hypothetical protein
MNKRNESRYYNRKANTRPLRQRFLIICEGKETEVKYFQSFPVPKKVIDVRGLGQNTLSLVKKAIKIRNDEKEFDRVWCVFDRDDYSKAQFKQACDIAQSEDIDIAYSNEAFEIWYILHLQYRDTAISRNEYERILTNLMRDKQLFNRQEKYQKNIHDMYEKLKPFQRTAIANAKKLIQTRDDSGLDPYDMNPSTTVYKLVEELNNNSRP